MAFCLEETMPVLAMVLVQSFYAAVTLSANAALSQGMSPMVFVVYRQAIAALCLAPATLLSKGGIKKMSVGIKAFSLVFLASVVGACLNQYLYLIGLNMASSSVASAMTNLTPAFTFVFAAAFGLEKVNVKSIRSIAKVIGTIICVGGAFLIGFCKGTKLLNLSFSSHELVSVFLHSTSDYKWVLGVLALMGSACCWSLWLIIQVPICKNYLDPLSLSTWMCILSTIISGTMTFFLEPDSSSWKITTVTQLLSCLFAGIFGSGVAFYLQSWSIALRGPLFSAMFNPLNTVIATFFAVIFFHEELYIGSMVGTVAVVGGLYVVLWGKAKDFDSKGKIQPLDGAVKQAEVESDLRKPLIDDEPDDVENQL